MFYRYAWITPESPSENRILSDVVCGREGAGLLQELIVLVCIRNFVIIKSNSAILVSNHAGESSQNWLCRASAPPISSQTVFAQTGGLPGTIGVSGLPFVSHISGQPISKDARTPGQASSRFSPRIS